MQTIYGVYANEDNIEGRGRVVLLELFVMRVSAEEFAKGQGPMGVSDGTVRPVKVFETVKERKDFLSRKQKLTRLEDCLRKLSEDDLMLLGVNVSDIKKQIGELGG